MKHNKFATVKNWLTHYALACGYVEVNREHAQYSLTLWHEGGNCFHVRLHDFKNHNRVFWDSFDTLPEARKAFTLACREFNLKRKQPNFTGYEG